MKDTPDIKNEQVTPALSKRAARRVIQRAFVLVERNKSVRQHLREADFTTLWVLEDWGLEWTVVIDRGKLNFRRGRSRKPQLTLVWRTAREFFDQIESESRVMNGFELIGNSGLRKFLDLVFQAFRTSLREVLTDPVDDAGERLL